MLALALAAFVQRETRADTTEKTVLQGDTLAVHMKPFDRQQFLLVNRGFHWINEYPFNR